MSLVSRQIAPIIKSDLVTFPVITLTGPRQSGKTTLLKSLLPDWRYANLEDPALLDFARSDPHGFLREYPDRVIIDEVQRAPDLLSMIQVVVDEDRHPGRFALSGSHNLLLLEKISQSLAGRTSIRNLLPFSFAEIEASGPLTLEEALFYGGFPSVHNNRESSSSWFDSYTLTYLERDVRLIRQVADLSTFQRFLTLAAGRAGSLLDLSGLGADSGITHNTAKDWISVLEAGFVAFRLQPFFKNFSKRLIKAPKLYFYDTGLLCRLLQVRNPDELRIHASRGAIFENWCVVEALKGMLNRGEKPGLYFWRDRKIEVDLLIQTGSTALCAVECKSGVTPAADYIDAAIELKEIITDAEVTAMVAYGGDLTQRRSDGTLFSWSDYGKMCATGFE